MAHRIGKHEKVGAALWRLLGDDVCAARHDLTSGERTQDEAVHRARQRLKRARSTLAVLEPVAGHAARELRRSIAAAARLLAGARDADIVAATARGLRETVRAGDDAGLDRVVAELERKAGEAHRRETPVDEVLARLALISTAIDALAGKANGKALFERAIGRAYRKGREKMKRAQGSLATPDLHAWRKEVKSLWHLVLIARKRLPKKTAAMAGDLKHLGDLLGYDHDHAVLAERLALSPDADHSLMRQLSMIAKERRSLEREALALGQTVYQKKPKAFGRRARLR